jgi:class 3 adenylate cyclase
MIEQGTPLTSETRPDGAKTRRFGFSISTLLSTTLGALILAAGLPILLVGYFATEDISRRLIRDRSELLLTAVTAPIEIQLATVAEMTDAAAGKLAEGQVQPDGEAPFVSFLQGLLTTNDHISGIAFVSPDGSLRRWSHDRMETLSSDDGMAARRKLLAQAAIDGKSNWSTPFLSNVDGEVVMTYRAPVRRDGQLLGMLTAAVSLRDVSTSLQTIGAEFDVVPFLLANRETIVAHPAMATVKSMNEPPTIATLGDQVMASMWKQQSPIREADMMRGVEGHWGVIDGVSYTFIYRNLRLDNADLLAGYYMRSALNQRDRLMRFYVAGLGGLLLIGAVAAAAYLGRRLAKPVAAFGETSNAIAQHDFSNVDLSAWRTSRVTEIAETATAIADMAKGIQFFQRYVPRTLVQRLLLLGDESSRPTKRNMTVLFLDLEGYTRFSTDRDADDISSFLNRFFARIGPLVEAGGGTIDKYTGDGLMAFWGAPIDNSNHARDALACAFRIVDALTSYFEEEARLNSDTCRVRMGLHTGDVVVGDLGYEGRIDYTVIGDVVNSAKRVESGLRGVAMDHIVVVAATEETLIASGMSEAFHRFEQIGTRQAWRIERRIASERAVPFPQP